MKNTALPTNTKPVQTDRELLTRARNLYYEVYGGEIPKETDAVNEGLRRLVVVLEKRADRKRKKSAS